MRSICASLTLYKLEVTRGNTSEPEYTIQSGRSVVLAVTQEAITGYGCCKQLSCQI